MPVTLQYKEYCYAAGGSIYNRCWNCLSCGLTLYL